MDKVKGAPKDIPPLGDALGCTQATLPWPQRSLRGSLLGRFTPLNQEGAGDSCTVAALVSQDTGLGQKGGWRDRAFSSPPFKTVYKHMEVCIGRRSLEAWEAALPNYGASFCDLCECGGEGLPEAPLGLLTTGVPQPPSPSHFAIRQGA